MHRSLHLYPRLTTEIIDELEIIFEPSNFYYTNRDGNKSTILFDNSDENTIELVDTNGNWDISLHDLILEQNIHIGNPSVLFGNNGLVPNKAKIGIGIIWYSRDSGQRGAEKIGVLSRTDKNNYFTMKMSFSRFQLRNKLYYEYVMYVEEIEDNAITSLANEYGLVLGSFYNQEIILEGSASFFPISTITGSKNDPLWKLSCSWGDLNDKFEDSVMLIINEKHKDYQKLNVENNLKFNRDLFNHILISAVFIILERARNLNQLDSIYAEELDNDSIGALIKYYMQTFEISANDDVEDVHSSIMLGAWR